jgi:GntR family transcriptional regulator/MocR family aminotransferase
MDVVSASLVGMPAHLRVASRIRDAIASGALAPNARVPSSRILARDWRLSRNTVDEALGRLAADGLIVRRRGVGSFVAQRMPSRGLSRSSLVWSGDANRPAVRISERARTLQRYPGCSKPLDAVPFVSSLPPSDVFPRKVWRRLLARESSRPGVDYWHFAASNGLPGLRRAIAAHANAMRATRAGPHQVIVTTSTQQAVELAAKVVADAGEAAWVENPGYQPAQYCLRAAGLSIVPVPVDQGGLDVVAGRRLADHARLAYVTPAHQFPTGFELSPARRGELLAWAHTADAYILEDDYDGDYRYEGRPLASLQGVDADRVVYIGSFNKILFPGLRLAFAIVPESLAGPFTDAKHVADGHTAPLAQGALAAFIDEGHLAQHVRSTREFYDERRRVFMAEAEAVHDLIEFGPARSGLHVAGAFRHGGISDREVSEACARRGIVVDPMSKFGSTTGAGLLFGFATCSRPAIRAGLAIVRQAILDAQAAGGAAGR